MAEAKKVTEFVSEDGFEVVGLGMSLVTLSCAVPVAEGEATLVAVTCSVAGDGRSAGAVYMPLDEIVPSEELPPEIPLTLQVTAVLLVPETAAFNCIVLPSKTLPVGGVTETETCGGGGGGVPELAPPPAQPGRAVAIARRLSNCKRTGVCIINLLGRERRRMPAGMQARCQSDVALGYDR